MRSTFCVADTPGGAVDLIENSAVRTEVSVSMRKLNVVGRQIGKLRYQRGMTQEDLAVELHSAGWESVTRSCISKIESGLIKVPDYMLYCFAPIFQVQPGELLPRIDSTKDIHEIILGYVRMPKRRLILPGDAHFEFPAC
jgi:transcriptional regulator with XRE-family HTH domain